MDKLEAAERRERDLTPQDTTQQGSLNNDTESSDVGTQSAGNQEERPPQGAEALDSPEVRVPTKQELAALLTDHIQLWEHYFSGIIDDTTHIVVENLEEGKAEFDHSVERVRARERGEYHFAGVCNFSLKLVFSNLRRGRQVANTFASIVSIVLVNCVIVDHEMITGQVPRFLFKQRKHAAVSTYIQTVSLSQLPQEE